MCVKQASMGKASDHARMPWHTSVTFPGVQNIAHLHCYEVASC